MKQPSSWKDLLANRNPSVEKNPDAAGHVWNLLSETGGKKFRVRRVDGRNIGAEVWNEPKVRRYTCKKCGISATEHPAEASGIVPDYSIHRNLSCDEIIIKDIIE